MSQRFHAEFTRMKLTGSGFYCIILTYMLEMNFYVPNATLSDER